MFFVVLRSIVKQHTKRHDRAVKLAALSSRGRVNQDSRLFRKLIPSFPDCSFSFLLSLLLLLLSNSYSFIISEICSPQYSVNLGSGKYSVQHVMLLIINELSCYFSTVYGTKDAKFLLKIKEMYILRDLFVCWFLNVLVSN